MIFVWRRYFLIALFVIISIDKYVWSAQLVITSQFWTNTRRKTFTLFIYSMGNEKKNGSLQQQNKTYKNSNNNKQTNKQKQNKIGKIQRQKKNINSNCGQLSLSLFHVWCIGYPDVPFIRYIYLVIWYLSPSRGRIL